jgi:hypothetical protein
MCLAAGARSGHRLSGGGGQGDHAALELAIVDGTPPVIKSRTFVADGFGQRADHGVFLIGPTGLALGSDGTLYASDALANRIVAIPKTSPRTISAGTGREISKDGLLQLPEVLSR